VLYQTNDAIPTAQAEAVVNPNLTPHARQQCCGVEARQLACHGDLGERVAKDPAD
jgi:hypothetical protein